MGDKAVLAYSGGLDTSVTIRWLVEQRLRGARGRGRRRPAGGLRRRRRARPAGGRGERPRGRRGGSVRRRVPDEGDQGERAVRGQVPDGVGPRAARASPRRSSRSPARSGADDVAHGCTGKGNDQVRFEVSFGVLAPDLRCWRRSATTTIPREKAIGLAEEWGIPVATVATTYSIDENLWGRTAECGPLEDPWVAPPEDAFARTAAPPDRPSEPAEIVVAFDRGVPVALDGETEDAARGDPRARRARRGLRVRPRRHDREPPRRHQEPRALRGAGRAGDHRGAPGAGGPHPRARPRAPQAAASSSAGPTSSTTGSGSRRCARRSTPTSMRRSRT